MNKTRHMNWKQIHSESPHEQYELWHDEKKLLSLEYHSFTSSARIEYEDTRRVFLLRKEGLLRNRIALRNEYGVRIGRLTFDKSKPNEGLLELDNKKFSFGMQNGEKGGLEIRSEDNQPLVHCGMGSDQKVTTSRVPGQAENFLLMALCWYLFLPQAEGLKLIPA
jgi:hypothetical protein